jgi:NADH-quinone oxidoreductase subunit F
MEQPLTRNITPDRTPLDLAGYEKAGGYQAMRKALKDLAPNEITQMVKDSNLRGRGGAGFPTGMKWSFVPMGDDAPHPKYLAVNADEMEPGTFKDRLLLEGDPHQMIESIIVSCYAVQANVAYIFVRWAYKVAAQRLREAIAQAYDKGYLGENVLGTGYSLDVYVHTSAGRYMCGEETGLLNSVQGTRARPRAKPPYPAVVGLWGRPTVVNNVETLCNVPHIVNNGPDWFKGLSHTEDAGTKLYGASGQVKTPGLWELPMGTSMREILEDHAGGMREGHRFRALLPGGASSQFVPEQQLDTPMDFSSMRKAIGAGMGTGTMIVLDDQCCPVSFMVSLQVFYARESCGWCTPCREGLPWVAQTLQAIENGEGEPSDTDLLAMHATLLGPGNTYCGLAPGATESLVSGLKYFRDEIDRHIQEKHCPWR